MASPSPQSNVHGGGVKVDQIEVFSMPRLFCCSVRLSNDTASLQQANNLKIRTLAAAISPKSRHSALWLAEVDVSLYV